MEKQSITALMSCFGRALDALATLCAPGNLLAFDYPDEFFFTASERRVQCTVRMAAAGGEPMRSSFSRAALEGFWRRTASAFASCSRPRTFRKTPSTRRARS